MKIAQVEVWSFPAPLTRPYTITFKTFTAVDILAVRIRAEDGLRGLGAASPEPAVTGESFADCETALAPERTSWLVGRDLDQLADLCRGLDERLAGFPAAHAALDMALHDLWARRLGLPLVDLLGRAHQKMPTSITIGIKGVAETLAEAEEYLGRGFRVLKVKLGHSLEEDLERLRKLRERHGSGVTIRADANQGFSLAQLKRLLAESAALAIEFFEQPLPASEIEPLRALPAAGRARLAADESLLSDADALDLAHPPHPFGIFNIKLMKCGGIRPALRIAAIAQAAGIDLMWGCMDESVISIAAALHAAFACPNTRYLDLDGSFDLARDLATGGFVLEEGILRTNGQPGLGVELV